MAPRSSPALDRQGCKLVSQTLDASMRSLLRTSTVNTYVIVSYEGAGDGIGGVGTNHSPAALGGDGCVAARVDG